MTIANIVSLVILHWELIGTAIGNTISLKGFVEVRDNENVNNKHDND